MSDLTTHPAANTNKAQFLAPETERNADLDTQLQEDTHEEGDQEEDTQEGEPTDEGTLSGASATYSPDDNKLRLRALSRLDAATFERVKAAGFRWAPRQELFVAPMWTPGRENLLIELCGEVGDEDTRLVDRADERADRFEEYGQNRKADALSARSAVSRIADNIPFGQPILRGHHSERHARKDAERIENGMRRAVKMWETAQYWKDRAEGARAHAEYKERPDVRHRRIKTIEADRRKVEKTLKESRADLAAWSREGLTMEQAKAIANTSHLSYSFKLDKYPRAAPASQYEGPMGLWSALDGGVITAEQARELATRHYPRSIAHCERWIAHYDNRLTYERAMLGEQGGLVADQFDLQPGGVVSWRGRKAVVVRVNRRDGKALSVTVAGQGWTVGVEEITAYDPPTETAAAAVAAAMKKPPLCNYPGAGFVHITQAQWDKCGKDYKSTTREVKVEGLPRHRARVMLGVFAGVAGDSNARHSYPFVYITDAKCTEPNAAPKAPRRSTARKVAEAAGIDTSDVPADEPAAALPSLRDVMREACAPTLSDVQAQAERVQRANAARAAAKAEAAEFEAMRDQLRTGVQVVVAPQLFPTPAPIAAAMVDVVADILVSGARVLEPSAGTGQLLSAVRDLQVPLDVVAVEINRRLVDGLRSAGLVDAVHCADFLDCSAEQLGGLFDAVLMNPPFANGDDIKHIRHAFAMLKPGGVLVAICANGPRQSAALRPMVAEFVGEWEDLPEGTFKEQGTNVRTAQITLRKP